MHVHTSTGPLEGAVADLIRRALAGELDVLRASFGIDIHRPGVWAVELTLQEPNRA